MREFIVNVPDNKSNKIISYPMSGFPLYTKEEAVKVMKSFGRKCPARIKPDNKLEVWAESDKIRFTLDMWNEDFNGVRTGI